MHGGCARFVAVAVVAEGEVAVSEELVKGRGLLVGLWFVSERMDGRVEGLLLCGWHCRKYLLD